MAISFRFSIYRYPARSRPFAKSIGGRIGRTEVTARANGVRGAFITLCLDRDNATLAAYRIGECIIQKYLRAQSRRYIPRPIGRPRAARICIPPRRSLQCAVLLFIVLHYGTLYPSCVINTRTGAAS